MSGRISLPGVVVLILTTAVWGITCISNRTAAKSVPDLLFWGFFSQLGGFEVTCNGLTLAHM